MRARDVPPRADANARVDAQRRYGAIRTLLISFGVAAFGYLLARTQPVATDSASALTLVAVGIAVQLALLAGGFLIRRHAPDKVSSAQAMFVLELLGDGITVLLFALATLRAVMPPSIV